MHRKLAPRVAACARRSPPIPRLPPSPTRPSADSFGRTHAALIRRVYEVDPLLCPCGATMRIVAVITERSVITKILAHLGKVSAAIATERAGPGPSRPPPSGPAPDLSVN